MHKIAFIFSMMILLVCGMQNAVAQQIGPPSDTIEVEGFSYTLFPKGIIDSVRYGDTLNFSFQLIPINLANGEDYSFNLFGYGYFEDGTEMPSYSILSDVYSGGAVSPITFRCHNSQYMLPDGNNSKRYVGYYPVHVNWHNGAYGELRLKLDITIDP